jgi:aspartate-semialdehyde dehydrogenase
MAEIKLGILGATGMAGRSAVIHQESLKQKGQDYASLELVTGSPQSQGKNLGEVFEEKERNLSTRYSFWDQRSCPEEHSQMEVQGIDAEKISNQVDHVISALPSAVAGEIEPELRKRGVNVFSNASEFRWKNDIPLIMPEVNPDQIKQTEEQTTRGKQVNNPNCTTAGFTPVLKALEQLGVEKVDITTFQAISGKGDKVSGSEYASGIKGNVADDWDKEKQYNGEEKKSELEPIQILEGYADREVAQNEGPDISVQTARVPTQFGHLESLKVTLSEETDREQVINAIEAWQPPEQVQELPSTSQTSLKHVDEQPEPEAHLHHGDGMSVVVGDIRQLDENRFSMFCLSHNLRQGATWKARQSMELYLKNKDLI